MSRSRQRSRNDHGELSKPPAKSVSVLKAGNGRWLTVIRYGSVFVCGTFLVIAGFVFSNVLRPEPADNKTNAPIFDNQHPLQAAAPTSHYDLLKLSPAELADVDFAQMNLLCAKGLPGSEHVDIPAILGKLDQWAAKVAFETKRHLYRANDPRYAAHYEHSEARLRAEFIVQVLQEDCGVQYNLERVHDPDYRNSKDIFIHGMVNSDNGGTCASMPVLYTAIARRLGYPIKLVLAREHVFMRWDDGRERFNIDGAGNGGIDYPTDDFYITWPHTLTKEMLESGEFLKSLTPQEELSLFLELRGICQQEHARYPDAVESYAAAHRLKPNAITPIRALAMASERKPVPKRPTEQVAAEFLDVLNMQRKAVARSIRAADDPTPIIPIVRDASLVPRPPQPSQPGGSKAP